MPFSHCCVCIFLNAHAARSIYDDNFHDAAAMLQDFIVKVLTSVYIIRQSGRHIHCRSSYDKVGSENAFEASGDIEIGSSRAKLRSSVRRLVVSFEQVVTTARVSSVVKIHGYIRCLECTKSILTMGFYTRSQGRSTLGAIQIATRTQSNALDASSIFDSVSLRP